MPVHITESLLKAVGIELSKQFILKLELNVIKEVGPMDVQRTDC